MSTAVVISAALRGLSGLGRVSTTKVVSRPDWKTWLMKSLDMYAVLPLNTTGTVSSMRLPLSMATLLSGLTLR
ncbi:hypothetical protein D3C72_2039720 [compost metagenome]